MITRNATKDDVEIIQEIFSAAPNLEDVVGESAAFADAELIAMMEDERDMVIVATNKDDVVVGFLIGTHSPAAKTAYISDIAVAEQERGNGYGTALIQHAITKVERHGVSFIWLLTDEQDQGMVPLLQRSGFERGREFRLYQRITPQK